MKAVPTIPTFTKIDVDALEKVKWTDDSLAGNALKALKKTLDDNNTGRVDYLKAAQLASMERVKIMQDGAKNLKKKQPAPGEIDDDNKLKAVRDDVKKLMNDVTETEKRYFAAMNEFRLKSKLDFAGKFAGMLNQMRNSTQDSDKAVATIPGQMKSLEGFASGLIKSIRELRGDVKGNIERKAKIEAAAKKANDMMKEAGTTIKKVDSAVLTIVKKLPNLPGSLAEINGKAMDSKNAYERFTKAMGATVTLRKSIEVMIKGFTGYGFEDLCKPMLKEVEKGYAALIKERDQVQKNVTSCLKQKSLPPEAKKLIPEKL